MKRSRNLLWLRESFRSLGVGGVATVLSFLALTLLVEVFRVSPQDACVPAMAVGSLVQFFGNRFWAFKNATGQPAVQLPLFLALEGVSMAIAKMAFSFAVIYLPYLIAQLLVTSLVFWCFSYPLWKRIFLARQPESV